MVTVAGSGIGREAAPLALFFVSALRPGYEPASGGYEIFISWSGAASKVAAPLMRRWFQHVLEISLRVERRDGGHDGWHWSLLKRSATLNRNRPPGRSNGRETCRSRRFLRWPQD